MDRRPPLALSPRRLRPRPRRPPPSAARTPPANAAKSRLPAFRASVSVETPSRLPEYQMVMSSELAALAKMAEEEFGIADAAASSPAAAAAAASSPAAAAAAAAAPRSPLFERGRFYDLYSARRNERLKRKMWGQEVVPTDGEALAQDPGVAVELSKKRGAKKNAASEAEGSLRKSLPGHFPVDRTIGLRSSARSAKEMKKPSAASGADGAAAAAGRRMVTRSSLRRL